MLEFFQAKGVSVYLVQSELEEEIPFKEYDQLAYVVNQNNYTIIVSRSGHDTILRDRCKRDYEGGWIFPKKKKITFYSGTLGEVYPEDQIKVKESIENYFRVNLRDPKCTEYLK